MTQAPPRLKFKKEYVVEMDVDPVTFLYAGRIASFKFHIMDRLEEEVMKDVEDFIKENKL